MTDLAPSLTGRVARCYCGAERSSDPSLAFFEFCGEGSPEATRRCKHCSYFEVAHDGAGFRSKLICDHFEPAGPLNHDRFYCGCHGFD